MAVDDSNQFTQFWLSGMSEKQFAEDWTMDGDKEFLDIELESPDGLASSLTEFADFVLNIFDCALRPLSYTAGKA